MDWKIFMQQIKIEVANSSLDSYVKDWFLNNALEVPTEGEGVELMNHNQPVRYKVLTSDKSDYRITYDEKTKKFGFESAAIIDGKIVHQLFHWHDTIVQAVDFY